MHWTAENIPREVNAKIWASLIAPRPLALISSVNEAGTPNIAPFNAFTGLANYPAMLGVSFSQRAGREKHTLANIKATNEFVVNLVPRFLADIMMQAAAGTDQTDDFERLGLTLKKSGMGNCPRIAECPASLECRMVQCITLAPSSCEFVIALVTGVYLRDEYVTDDQLFDPMAADLLASVGVETYLSLNGETLVLPRTWE